jgi:hypothetical protein
MLLTWRYAHALRGRPAGETRASYDERPVPQRTSTLAATDRASSRGPGQTVIARFTQTSPISMPTFW